MAGSYGSTTRYKSVERLKAVSNNTLLGATGEISDFQAILQLLDRLMYVLLFYLFWCSDFFNICSQPLPQALLWTALTVRSVGLLMWSFFVNGYLYLSRITYGKAYS